MMSKFTLDFRDLTLKFTLDFRDLILNSPLLFKITGTHGNGIPIGGDINPKQNKFILLDIGLYLCEAKLDVSNWILDPGAKFVTRGKMAEMFAALEILKNASPYDDGKLFYWHRESKNSNAEVDYVVQYRNRILPIEVKSGKSGSMASLRIMMESKNLTLGVRTSEENFGALENHIRIIPLYMIGEYDRILRAAGEGEDGI